MIPKEYILSLAKKGERADGRKFTELRQPVKVEYGVSKKSAEGSARVTIGDTEVIAGVKFELGKPYPDTPNKGSIMVNVELLPLSSSAFEMGPPSIDSIELSRVVDRGLRESESLNFEKLCVKVGEAMWMIIIDIYPINAAGNLFDACALAAIAALKDARFPTLNEEDGNFVVDYSTRTDTPLPLEKEPIECTVWKVNGELLVDLTPDEELAAEARLTVAITEENKVCAMQKGGETPFTEEEILKIIDLAIEKTSEIRKVF